ncbi:MAG: prephenate dehydratase [Polyangiales bacterium]
MTDPTPEALEGLRRKLDEIDRHLVETLGERHGVVADVARLKSAGTTTIRDPERERAILERIGQLGAASGLEPGYVKRLYRLILDESVRVQQEMLGRASSSTEGRLVVGYQGGEGAFSHMAAMAHFQGRASELVFVGYPSFPAMLEAVRTGEIRYAVLPIENSIAGSINENYDLLARMDLHLVGEQVQRIEHCLIGLAEVPLHQIRRVYSHPVALAQCTAFLATLENCHVEAYQDTALSVAKIKEDQDLSQAAIASEEAARIHGLPVLRRDIANNRENYTRMVIVAREPVAVDPRVPCKTSVVLSLAHEQGALSRSIHGLASRGLNLTKLESRPIPGRPFEYLFYVDFEGNVATSDVKGALEELGRHTQSVRVLGTYPSHTPQREA